MVVVSAKPVWQRRHRSKIPLVVTVLLAFETTASVCTLHTHLCSLLFALDIFRAYVSNAGLAVADAYFGFVTYRANPGTLLYWEMWDYILPVQRWTLH